LFRSLNKLSSHEPVKVIQNISADRRFKFPQKLHQISNSPTRGRYIEHRFETLDQRPKWWATILGN